MLQQDNNNQPSADTATQTTNKSKFVEIVREGAIGASIFLTERKDGSMSHYFKLSRSYKIADEQPFKYSENFYARNGEAIAKVATEAAQKCKEFDQALKQ